MKALRAGLGLMGVATLLGVAVPALAKGCANSRPETVVADLYLRHGSFATNAARASLSAPLRLLLEAERRSSGAIDGRPWGVGIPRRTGERMLITDTLIEGSRANTRLSYRVGDEAAPDTETLATRLQLVREADGCWRIDDIERDGVSLRARLGAVKPPEPPASR